MHTRRAPCQRPFETSTATPPSCDETFYQTAISRDSVTRGGGGGVVGARGALPLTGRCRRPRPPRRWRPRRSRRRPPTRRRRPRRRRRGLTIRRRGVRRRGVCSALDREHIGGLAVHVVVSATASRADSSLASAAATVEAASTGGATAASGRAAGLQSHAAVADGPLHRREHPRGEEARGGAHGDHHDEREGHPEPTADARRRRRARVVEGGSRRAARRAAARRGLRRGRRGRAHRLDGRRRHRADRGGRRIERVAVVEVVDVVDGRGLVRERRRLRGGGAVLVAQFEGREAERVDVRRRVVVERRAGRRGRAGPRA